MKRGEVWTSAGGGDYVSKPRPVVIVQDDRFDGTDSITICPLTSDPTELPLFRVAIAPSETNGLSLPSRVMADKVSTLQRAKLGYRIGVLDDRDISRLNQAIVVFLGLATSPAS